MPDHAQAPQPIENASEGKFIPNTEAEQQSVSQGYFNQQVGVLKTNLENANSVSYFIVIILFVGFLSMFGIVISILIQWWSFNVLTQSDLTKAVQGQNMILQKMSTTQDQIQKTLTNMTPAPLK